MSSTCF